MRPPSITSILGYHEPQTPPQPNKCPAFRFGGAVSAENAFPPPPLLFLADHQLRIVPALGRMHRHVKYWILPDIENRIRNGEIKAFFNSAVTQIAPDSVTVETPEGQQVLPNDAVLAMTGYRPDFEFLESLGVRIEGEFRCPACDPKSLESNVAGIYLAGVIVAGDRTNEIFIENGRFHGRQIAEDLKHRLRAAANV